jgi:hypothetical protein
MIILIHNICIAFNGVGKPNAVAMLAIVNAAKDVLKSYHLLKPHRQLLSPHLCHLYLLAIPISAPFNALASFYIYRSIQLVNEINRISNKGTMNVFLEYLLKRTPFLIILGSQKI